MKGNIKISLWMWFLVLVSVVIPLIGTPQNLIKNDSVQAKTVALELTQIPEFGNKTRDLINDIQQIITEEKDLDIISRGISDVKKVLEQKHKVLSDTVVKFQLESLDKEDREITILSQRIAEWNSTVEQIIVKGRQKDSLVLSMIHVWQLTLDSMGVAEKYKPGQKRETKRPNDIKAEIINFISSLQDSQKNLYTYLDSVQNIQAKITIAENYLGSISSLIESNRSFYKHNIWIPESPPIWEVGKDTTGVNKIQRVKGILNSSLNIVRTFLADHQKLPYYFSVLIILFFGIIWFLRISAEKLYIDYQEEFKQAKVVLSRPLLSSLIIVWFFIMFFPFFPKEVKTIISMVMILPLIILLKKLNPGWRWYTLVLIAFYFLLFLVVRKTDYTFLAQRIFLIVINVLTLLVFVYYKKNRKLTEELNIFWYGSLRFIFNILIVIGIISLLASIFGSIQLSELLSYVIFGTIIAIYALNTAIRLLTDFIFLVLMGPLLKYSYILKDDGKIVLNKMGRLFRFVAIGLLVYIILELLYIRKDTFNAVLGIINYQLKVGEMSISLGNILAFFITIQIAVWISSALRYVLEKEVFPRSNLKQGVPNTISLLIKFTIVVLGIILAFSAAGIQMDKLAIAMGAIGVGIGFGLQNIIANFISGIILAIERPITIGDLIDLPNVSGVVKDIGLRTSVVRTWDGSDVIIPNAELTSNKVTNWTLYDRHMRIKIDVRVPFDADIEAVSQLLLATAGEIPEVMKSRKPYLNFKGIGTSAMEITLYCWIDDSDRSFSYGTIIRKAIYKALNDAGYKPPLPVQDLNILPNKTDENKGV